MRVTASRVYSRPTPVPKMPPGLVELMEGLTTEVLKYNPPNVYEFCAEHMRKLLEIRDGPSNPKVLSLEQKIARAQEKVKKRAEQRQREYKELQEKAVENVTVETSRPSVDTTQSFRKPVHQDHDLTQTSEIEISCESNTEPHKHLEDVKGNVCSEITDTERGLKDANPLLEIQKEEKNNVAKDVLELQEMHNKQKDIENQILKDEKDSTPIDGNNFVFEESNVNSKDDQEIRHEQTNHDEGQSLDKINLLHEKTSNPNITFTEATDDKGQVLDEIDLLQDKTIIPNMTFPETAGDKGQALDDVNLLQDKTIDPNVDPNVTETADDKGQGLDEVIILQDPKITFTESTGGQLSNGENDINKTVHQESGRDLVKEKANDVIIGSHIDSFGENTNSKSILDSDDNACDNEKEKLELQTLDTLEVIHEEVNNAQTASVLENIAESNSVRDRPDVNIELESMNQTKIQFVDGAKPESHIGNLNVVKVTDEITTINNITSLENNENKDDVNVNHVNNSDYAEPITGINLTENLENVADLEKVLNEAIENSKRKDSCANESLKDINSQNSEDSDASESSTPLDTITAKSKDGNCNVPKNTSDDIKDAVTIAVSVTENDIMSGNDKDSDEIKRNLQVAQSSINDSNLTDKTVSLEKCDDPNTKVSEISADITQNDNVNSMDLETAAVTIQKVFRTFLFKSRASTFDDAVNDDNHLSDEDEKKDERQFLPGNANKERRTLGISRMDTVLQTVNEEKSLSLSTDDSSLSSAATIIQAHVRGFLVRNKLHPGKTASSNSLVISNDPSCTSIDGDADQNKNKTVLNIHIVPEGGNYLSRDESMLTSMDLSLDGSPPSSVNLHPLGYNTSERRKLLKREDAVQSVSPPSNNSGKLSEDVDSVKEMTINENESNNFNQDEKVVMATLVEDTNSQQETDVGSLETTPTTSLTIETIVGDNKTSNTEMFSSPEPVTELSDKNRNSLTKQSSDEMDVVTPFKGNGSPRDEHKLLHSGEFHDAVLPTKVSRSDTPVASGE